MSERNELGWNKEAQEYALMSVPYSEEWPATLEQTLTRATLRQLDGDAFQAGRDSCEEEIEELKHQLEILKEQGVKYRARMLSMGILLHEGLKMGCFAGFLKEKVETELWPRQEEK